MVDVADIRNEESLKAWLEDQPREVAVWIASRAAARVLPVWWEDVITSDWARRRNVTALLVLRSLLLSSVASNARDAANTRNTVRAAAPAVRAAARAARTAAFAAVARAPDNTVHDATAALAALAAEDAWEAFRADA